MAFWPLAPMSSVAPLPRLKQRLVRIVHTRRPWQWLLGVLALVVCYLAFSPRPPSNLSIGWDKLNHAAAFIALSFSACLAFPGRRRHMLLAAVGLFLFGAVIEVVQLFVPGRDCEWEDLLADSVGIAIGALIALALLRAARTRR